NILNNINVTVEPSAIEVNRRMQQNDLTGISSVRYSPSGLPATDLPLKASFAKGEGEVFPTYKTDDGGNAKVLLNRIGSAELEQSVVVQVNTEALAGGSDTSIFQFVTRSLRVPSASIVLRVQRPVVYLTSSERSLGRENRFAQVTNKLKNFLARSGFEFTNDKGSADLWFEVKTNTEEGSVAGSIFVTYLNGVIR